jgi:hypothetical protein
MMNAMSHRVPRVLAAAVLLASCSGEPEPGPTTPAQPQLIVTVASYELLAGRPNRFTVGVQMQTGPEDTKFVSYGSVSLRFRPVASADQQPIEAELGPDTPASFLLVPDLDPSGDPADGPRATLPNDGRGVYVAYDMGFDPAGFWEVQVTADVQDVGPLNGVANFQVLAEPSVPAPGERALRTKNLTMESTDAPPSAIDSRAGDDLASIPDPELHDWTIAEAIAEHRPVLVTFSTPAFCQSKFCGPVTDVVADLAADYPDRAVFIHVEVWRDYAGGVINRAAADWLLRDGNLTEPWLFLIGANGTVLERWENLYTREEVEPSIRALPPMSS